MCHAILLRLAHLRRHSRCRMPSRLQVIAGTQHCDAMRVESRMLYISSKPGANNERAQADVEVGLARVGPVWTVFGIPIAIGIVGMQVMFPPTMATIPTRQAARFFRTCSLTAAIEVGLVRPVVAEFQRSRVPVDVNAKRSLNTTHRFVFAAGAIEDSSALLFHRSFRLNHAVRSKQFDGRENMVCASYYDLTWSHRSNTSALCTRSVRRRQSILHPCRTQDLSQRLGFSLQCLLTTVQDSREFAVLDKVTPSF